MNVDQHKLVLFDEFPFRYVSRISIWRMAVSFSFSSLSNVLHKSEIVHKKEKNVAKSRA